MYSRARMIAGGHALYLLATGVWPLLHRGSFERVTGKKDEFWLVRTVGGLAATTGVSLAVSVIKGSKRTETVALALGSSIVFGLADAHAAHAQSRLYLGDVVVQLGCLPAWFAAWDADAPSAACRSRLAAARAR